MSFGEAVDYLLGNPDVSSVMVTHETITVTVSQHGMHATRGIGTEWLHQSGAGWRDQLHDLCTLLLGDLVRANYTKEE